MPSCSRFDVAVVDADHPAQFLVIRGTEPQFLAEVAPYVVAELYPGPGHAELRGGTTVEIVERTILVLVRRGDRRERDAVRELVVDPEADLIGLAGETVVIQGRGVQQEGPGRAVVQAQQHVCRDRRVQRDLAGVRESRLAADPVVGAVDRRAAARAAAPAVERIRGVAGSIGEPRRRAILVFPVVQAKLGGETFGGRRIERRLDIARLALAELLAEPARVAVLAVGVVLARVDAEAQLVSEDRPFDRSAEVRGAEAGGLGLQLALPLAAGIARDDVDCAGESGAAEVGALRALHDLDPLDVREAPHLGAQHRGAVDEHRGALLGLHVRVELHAADQQPAVVARVRPDGRTAVEEAGREVHHLVQFTDAFVLDGFRGQHRDGQRHVDQGLLALPRRDRDFLEYGPAGLRTRHGADEAGRKDNCSRDESRRSGCLKTH